MKLLFFCCLCCCAYDFFSGKTQCNWDMSEPILEQQSKDHKPDMQTYKLYKVKNDLPVRGNQMNAKNHVERTVEKQEQTCALSENAK